MQAVFVGNGLVAILAGLIANYLVSNLGMGPVAPFDAAIVSLIIGGLVIYAVWGENYGDSRHSHTLKQQLQLAVAAIIAGKFGYTLCAMPICVACTSARPCMQLAQQSTHNHDRAR